MSVEEGDMMWAGTRSLRNGCGETFVLEESYDYTRADRERVRIWTCSGAGPRHCIEGQSEIVARRLGCISDMMLNWKGAGVGTNSVGPWVQ